MHLLTDGFTAGNGLTLVRYNGGLTGLFEWI